MRSFKYLSEHNYFTGYHTSRWRQPCYRKKFILMTHPQELRYQRASFLLVKSLLLGWSSCLHDSDAFLCLPAVNKGRDRDRGGTADCALNCHQLAFTLSKLLSSLTACAAWCQLKTNSFAKFSFPFNAFSCPSSTSYIYNTARNLQTGGTLISYGVHLHNFSSLFYSVNTTNVYAAASCAEGSWKADSALCPHSRRCGTRARTSKYGAVLCL